MTARRIRVVGNSGSGKTTLARHAAVALAVPHLELDSIYHGPGWQPATAEEFAARLAAFLDDAPDGWVLDGNYRAMLSGTPLGEDLTVWLDLPRPVVMARVVRRTVGRLVTRGELWNGNRESWRSMLRLDPKTNIVRWAWTQHHAYRRQYLSAFAEAEPGTWARLRSRREAKAWLRALDRA